MPPVQTGPTHGLPVKANPDDWRVQLLNRIKAPVSSTNLTALQAWALSESGYNSTYGTNMAGPGYFNPLAISDGYGVPTVRSINGDGVKEFGNTQAGVEATARFFEHGYTDIIQSLRSNDPVALYSAVNNSGWCAGCESGHYPVGLYGWLQGGNVQGSGQHFSGGGPGTAGLNAGGQAGGGGGNSSGSGSSDSGGLFGTCNITTEKGIFGIGGGIPTGGFGCYIEKGLIFTGLAVGGGILMSLGLTLVVLPALAKTAGPVAQFMGPVGKAASLGTAVASRVKGGSSPPAATPAVKTLPTLAQQREKRQQELHRARKGKANADARTARAKAREAELRAPTGKSRVAAAGRGETRAAGPVAGAGYEVPGL